ncbi:hypothetical protein GB931_10640 [Modestobacter sp. I12A-02628]|uniref:Uncharacterized protein n=1 Tax=Goekera deserti TaxID=2497753 RepID=A0A7K3WBV9_9ACTN|nr:hypothetical protein [Goekera deserti]MPQ98366.1 hypothetical protein [Goekera deserti]NDI48193.1 hypothetical protein [Goekera deserti]NEL53942.1 hypothetical protein [Goekera deserti]
MTHSQIDSTYSTTTTTDTGAAPVSQGTSSPNTTTDVAKDEARNVGQTAANAGSQVAATAADEAKHVAGEAKAQATNVIGQGRQQVTQQVQTQAKNGQQKAVQSISALASELRTMAEGGQPSSGPATDIVRQATDKLDEVAHWIESREPGDLVEEVRSFARRRPGAFLLGAAVAGVLAGRLTSGVVSAHKDSSPSGTSGTAPRQGLGAPSQQGNWVEETYTPETSSYATAGTQAYGQATPAHGQAYETGYTETTTGSVPPPPYGTVPPAGSVVPPTTPSGWDDPQRGLGQGGQQ